MTRHLLKPILNLKIYVSSPCASAHDKKQLFLVCDWSGGELLYGASPPRPLFLNGGPANMDTAGKVSAFPIQ